MATSSNAKDQRVFLAYLAAGLFALAGLIQAGVGYARICSATTPHSSLQGTGMLGVGAAFMTVSALWSLIALQWKKEAANRSLDSAQQS